MKKIAILQSNYIPWKGYFDLIAAVDEFILYDDVQYTRRDWRNRNLIKTPQGPHWLTVPVKVKGKYFQSIKETEIARPDWAHSHWINLTQNYRKASNFLEVAPWIESLYLSAETQTYLSNLNRFFINNICNYLEISTIIRDSCDYSLIEGKTERLVHLCLQAGATEYVTGPAAKDYLLEDMFASHNIKVTWFNYEGYPVYKQIWGDFIHNVSILDLLFNCGKSSKKYLKFTCQ